jgi:hypothetical protein
LLGGFAVLWLFIEWEGHLLARGKEPLIDPKLLRNTGLRDGLVAFFAQYFVQGGLFFAIPLFLSVALGLSAIETGVRLLPLSVTLLLTATGVPRFFPEASPRRVAQLGFLALFAGLVALVAALDQGAGADIVTWPMLLAGVGVGALASQLGSVTVSSVPDEQTDQVGGLQNTITNLGISVGTALSGALVMAVLSSTFVSGVLDNPQVPARAKSNVNTQLAANVPFISDDELEDALKNEHVPPRTADAIAQENETAQLAGLRTAIAVLALVAICGAVYCRRLPNVQPALET